MTLWAVLATGPSMSREVAEQVKGRCGVIAVSNAYTVAPWADALVSHDTAWWREHPDAKDFAGRKFCAIPGVAGTEYFRRKEMPYAEGVGCNSGLMAMFAAAALFGATRIALLGFDMQGDHFFGRHKPPLRNTSEARRRVHLNQFERFKACPVVNCTPGSALKHFPMGDIEGVLQEWGRGVCKQVD